MPMGRLKSLGRGKWNANDLILVRDPEQPTAIPDPVLDALIHERLRGDEIVYHWNEFRRGEVSVLLISAGFNRLCERIAAKSGSGREGGCGRSLSFRYQDNQWVLMGEGEWIS